MKKKKIGIIFGGKSSEYGVSLESCYSVLSHIDQNKFEIYMIGINQKGEWKHFEGDIQMIQNDTWDNQSLHSVYVSLDASKQCLIEVIDNKINEVHIDAIFPILHGKNGEDGTVQGIIQIANIPLIGCDLLSSALCMDKYKAHQLVEMNGIKTAKSVYLENQQVYSMKQKDIFKLKLPIYIKPLKAGSSLGISRIESFDLLDEAIQHSFQYDDEIIVEEEVEGFEVGCAVMGIDDLIVGRVDEIELSQGFFDFEEKYSLQTSKIHMPARIDKELEKKIQTIAKSIYKILGCRIFARVDMFLTPHHEIVFNEVNTIPGFTAHSRYPHMMEGAGIRFQELLTHLIEMGIEDANARTI